MELERLEHEARRRRDEQPKCTPSLQLLPRIDIHHEPDNACANADANALRISTLSVDQNYLHIAVHAYAGMDEVSTPKLKNPHHNFAALDAGFQIPVGFDRFVEIEYPVDNRPDSPLFQTALDERLSSFEHLGVTMVVID
jgi:hypothetical protein